VTIMSSENCYTEYDSWAWLYNQSEAHLVLQELLPRLEKLLLPNLPKHGQILDLCCGTGQVSQQLSLRGFQMTGLDNSKKMLEHASEKVPNGVFLLEDARSFNLSPTFDAAICTDSSLNHMMSLEDLKRVFGNVYAALKENGLFLFDLGLENRYRNIAVSDGELQSQYAWTVGETYKPEDQTGTFTITVFQPSQKNSDLTPPIVSTLIQQLKRSVYNHILRHLKPSTLLPLIDKSWQASALEFPVKSYAQAEVEAALAEIGFTQIKVYDAQGKTIAPTNTEYAYFLAHKPDGIGRAWPES
jgi:SAM-dependent methyltransferase